VEEHEALKTGAVIRKLANAIKHKINNLLANGVVTASVVVSGILLTGNQLLRVVKLTVGSGADLVADSGLKIHHNSTRYVLSGASLRKKGVERVITSSDGLVRRHLAIGLNSVLKAVKLPACVTSLDTSLAKVD
jgi:hypothetical protein